MAIEDLPLGKHRRALVLRDLLRSASEAAFDGAKQAEYAFLRGDFMADPETEKYVPEFVTEFDQLSDFYQYVKKMRHYRLERRIYVNEQIAPLLAKLGRSKSRSRLETEAFGTAVQRDPGPVSQAIKLKGHRPSDGSPTPRPAGQDDLPSSSWTGRFTRKEHAQFVLSLAPAALEGVRSLLGEQEQRLHNYPPSAIEQISLQALRELDMALAELLESAEEGGKLKRITATVRRLYDKVFSFAADTGELCVAGLKPLLASAPAAWGTWTLLGLICNPVTFATLGPIAAAAVTGGYFGLELKRKPPSAGTEGPPPHLPTAS